MIKDVQKMMPIDNTLLKVLICLNPKDQKAYNSLQHYMVVVGEMLIVQAEEGTAGDG